MCVCVCVCVGLNNIDMSNFHFEHQNTLHFHCIYIILIGAIIPWINISVPTFTQQTEYYVVDIKFKFSLFNEDMYNVIVCKV